MPGCHDARAERRRYGSIAGEEQVRRGWRKGIKLTCRACMSVAPWKAGLGELCWAAWTRLSWAMLGTPWDGGHGGQLGSAQG
jgi:hypothetical protein